MFEELQKYPLTAEDENVIKEWEKRLKKHNLYKTFREHPVSQDIINGILASISVVNQGLLAGEYTEEKRKEMVLKRKVWSDFLVLFGDFDTDEIIKQEAENALKLFKNYYGEK